MNIHILKSWVLNILNNLTIIRPKKYINGFIMVDKEKVKEVLEKIRPQLQMDGGDVELVEITDDGIVKVRLQGHCAGCAHAQQTLQFGIERAIKQFVPDVVRVENVA